MSEKILLPRCRLIWYAVVWWLWQYLARHKYLLYHRYNCSCINPIIYGVYYFTERNSTTIVQRNHPVQRWGKSSTNVQQIKVYTKSSSKDVQYIQNPRTRNINPKSNHIHQRVKWSPRDLMYTESFQMSRVGGNNQTRATSIIYR